MPSHEKPNPPFSYTFTTERNALRSHKAVRNIPDKSNSAMLAASWNLTNFGEQQRSDDDLKLMAEIISWFDFIAIQEVKDDLTHLRSLLQLLPGSYRTIVSDPAGNNERAGFIYDSGKLERLELAGEVAVPPSHHRHIRLKGISGVFEGFDRNPHLVAFRAGNLSFTAVTTHLYFGSESYRDEDRRTLEAFALARWAALRMKSAHSFTSNVLLMGDFNLPKRDPKDKVYKALTKKGLILPSHSSKIGSNLHGDKDYDQIGFHQGGMKDAFKAGGEVGGVFDFDADPFFKDAWNPQDDSYFQSVIKYHIADHRPIWFQFAIN